MVCGIIIGSRRVFVQIEPRKSLGPLLMLGERGVAEPKKIKVRIRFAMVHPVVVGVELVVDLAVLGELPRDSIPQFLGQGCHVFMSAQGVVQREVVKALVAVIRAIHARPLVAPNDGAVFARVFLDEFASRRIQLLQHMTLPHGPRRWQIGCGQRDDPSLCRCRCLRTSRSRGDADE